MSIEGYTQKCLLYKRKTHSQKSVSEIGNNLRFIVRVNFTITYAVTFLYAEGESHS